MAKKWNLRGALTGHTRLFKVGQRTPISILRMTKCSGIDTIRIPMYLAFTRLKFLLQGEWSALKWIKLASKGPTRRLREFFCVLRHLALFKALCTTQEVWQTISGL